jgi:hypothetical protein
MRNSRMLTFSLAAIAALALGAAQQARAVAEPEGCCCIAGPGGEACTETTEKSCLAKQQAAPRYDEKTKYEDALKKSEAEEAGQMKSGWKEGKCAMK